MRRILTAILLLLAGPALAQESSCGQRADVVGYLAANYSETPVGLGLTSDGNVLEVVVSRDGTWTMIVTMPNGVSCAVAAGADWSRVTPATQVAADDGEF